MQVWDLWYPNAGAQGLSFCRARVEDVERIWVHAPPDTLRVEVRDERGSMLAAGDQLTRTSPERLPMARLRIAGQRVEREDAWPADADAGSIVLLPGGEAGVLTSWWNAPAHDEWRWTVEFYNHL